MKKLTLLLILVLAFSSPIYSQSFLSFRTNLFSFTRTYYTPDYIKAKVDYVTKKKGGEGREKEDVQFNAEKYGTHWGKRTGIAKDY